jgi:hypothetical protein
MKWNSAKLCTGRKESRAMISGRWNLRALYSREGSGLRFSVTQRFILCRPRGAASAYVCHHPRPREYSLHDESGEKMLADVGAHIHKHTDWAHNAAAAESELEHENVSRGNRANWVPMGVISDQCSILPGHIIVAFPRQPSNRFRLFTAQHDVSRRESSPNCWLLDVCKICDEHLS